MPLVTQLIKISHPIYQCLAEWMASNPPLLWCLILPSGVHSSGVMKSRSLPLKQRLSITQCSIFRCESWFTPCSGTWTCLNPLYTLEAPIRHRTFGSAPQALNHTADFDHLPYLISRSLVVRWALVVFHQAYLGRTIRKMLIHVFRKWFSMFDLVLIHKWPKVDILH